MTQDELLQADEKTELTSRSGQKAAFDLERHRFSELAIGKAGAIPARAEKEERK